MARGVITGQITITPPIQASDLRGPKAQQLLIPNIEPTGGAPDSGASAADMPPVMLHTTTVATNTPTGQTTTTSGDALMPRNAGLFSVGGLQTALQKVLDGLGAGHTWTGHLEVTEIGTPPVVYRIAVSTAGGVLTAVRVDPVVTWPADPA